MTINEKDLKRVESLLDELGEDNFQNIINEIWIRKLALKRANCKHDWKLSQIAGDGYTCYKCGSWKPED